MAESKKKKQTGNKKNSRRKDATSDIRLLRFIYPDIDTRLASILSNRSVSLTSHVLSRLRDSEPLDPDRARVYAVNQDAPPSRVKPTATEVASVHLLIAAGFDLIKIPDILGISARAVRLAIGILEESTLERNVCEAGHVSFFLVEKGSSAPGCPFCFYEKEKSFLLLPKKKDARVIPENEYGAKSVLDKANMIISNYYVSRSRGSVLLEQILEFAEVLVWLHERTVRTLHLQIPFDKTMELAKLCPYRYREHLRERILSNEKNLKDTGSKVGRYETIEDVLFYLLSYAEHYRVHGNVGKGTIIVPRFIPSDMPFFGALWS